LNKTAAKIIGFAKWLLWPEPLGTGPPGEAGTSFLGALAAGETLPTEPAAPASPAPPGLLRYILAPEKLGPPGPETPPPPPSLLRRLIAREDLTADGGRQDEK